MNSKDHPASEDHLPRGKGVDRQRAHAANLVERQRSIILSRIHRLLGNDARSLANTDDILSTALRRIDQVIMQGGLEAQSERQFYAFVHGVIERTIMEKARKSRGLTAREKMAQEIREAMPSPVVGQRVVTAEELNQIGGLITDPIDREIVLLRGRDLSFIAIAEAMQMAPSAVRKRWSRIRALVRKHIEESLSDDDHK